MAVADHADDDSRFNESAALEELERVRQEIERYQAVRAEVNDEFERFIKSFKPLPPVESPPPTFSPAHADVEKPSRHTPAPAPLSPDPASAEVPRAPFEPSVAFLAGTATEPSTPFDSLETPGLPIPEARDTDNVRLERVVSHAPVPPDLVLAPPPPAVVRHRANPRTWLVLGSVVAIVSAGGYAWTSRKGRPDPSATTTTSAVAATTPVTAPKPSPIAPPRAPSPFESVLVTTRPAWVRVIADGERVLERELPADARIPFTARKTIVVRTGDAGAVRLTIGGVDRGVLGREGEVVTRTFTVAQ